MIVAGTVMVECAAAVGIACDRTLRSGRRIALGLLTVFVPTAGWHWAVGHVSCHCFGQRVVTPVWTLTFDLLMAITIWWAGRVPGLAGAGRARPAAVLAAGLALAMAAALWPSGESDGGSGMIVLGGDDLSPGQPFPLLAYLGDADRDDLASGDRVVVLYRNGCDHCRQYVAGIARDPEVAGRRPELRYVDVPYVGDKAGDDGPDVPIVSHPLRLRAGVNYVLTVPARLELHQGVVRRVSTPES